MFNFMKNFKKPNAKRSVHAAVFDIDVNDYMAQNESGIIDVWSDARLMELINVTNLFAEGACVQNTSLSYEDAVEALNRANRMAAMGTYVMNEFCARSEALPRKCGRSIDDNNFYSANTLRNLFVEASAMDFDDIDSVPANVEDVIEEINESLKCFGLVKNNLFFVTVNEAKISLNVMKGFV